MNSFIVDNHRLDLDLDGTPDAVELYLNEIEFAGAYLGKRLIAVYSLVRDRHIGRGREDLLQSFAHQRMVVGDQQADHAEGLRSRRNRGMRAATRVPPSGLIPISVRPPR